MFNPGHSIIITIGIIISIILAHITAPEIVLNVMPENSRLKAGFR